MLQPSTYRSDAINYECCFVEIFSHQTIKNVHEVVVHFMSGYNSTSLGEEFSEKVYKLAKPHAVFTRKDYHPPEWGEGCLVIPTRKYKALLEELDTLARDYIEKFEETNYCGLEKFTIENCGIPSFNEVQKLKSEVAHFHGSRL